MKPSLGEFLREAIKNIPRMSIRNLERRSGISNSEICKIINGSRKTPNPAILKSIALPLKVDYTYLYYLAGYLDEDDWKAMEENRIRERKTIERDDLPLGQVRETRETYYPIGGLSSEEQEIVLGFRSLTDLNAKSCLLSHLRLALKAEGKLPSKNIPCLKA